MKEILEPLTLIPGVRLAAMVSQDGVPIALLEGNRSKANPAAERDLLSIKHDFHAYSGLAAGWLGEVKRCIAPLSWDTPRRVVLRGTRGTLVLHVGPGAVVLVVLEHGVGAEELRVPMEGAIARMQRHLRTMSNSPGGESPQQGWSQSDGQEPTGIHPSSTDFLGTPANPQQTTTPNHFSEVPGEN